jgi:hypothetical protein
VDVYLKRLGVPFPESPKTRLEPKREGALFVYMYTYVYVYICVYIFSILVRTTRHASPPTHTLNNQTPQKQKHQKNTGEDLWFDNWALAWGRNPQDWYASPIVPEAQKLQGTFPQEFVDRMHRQITTRKRTMCVFGGICVGF